MVVDVASWATGGRHAVGGWTMTMDVPMNSAQSSTTTTAFSLSIPSSSFPTSSSFPNLSQETTSSTSTLVDPNSPELFRQNIQIAMEQVARVNAHARNALNGMYGARLTPSGTFSDAPL